MEKRNELNEEVEQISSSPEAISHRELSSTNAELEDDDAGGGSDNNDDDDDDNGVVRIVDYETVDESEGEQIADEG